MHRILLGLSLTCMLRDSGTASDGASGGAPTPLPSLSDLVTNDFKGLTDGDQAQNVINASSAAINELKGLTFSNLSPLGQQIMATQVAEAVKTIELSTKAVLDEVEA